MTVQITVPTKAAVEALWDALTSASEGKRAANTVLDTRLEAAVEPCTLSDVVSVGAAAIALRDATRAEDKARDAWVNAKRLRDTYAGGAS